MTRTWPWRPFLAPTIAAIVYGASLFVPGLWEAVLGALFPDEVRVLYHAPMPLLVWQTLLIVAASSALSIGIGMGLGVFVTRPFGADFFDVVTDLSNLGQTFPPIAVFTLAVPLLGFGFRPTVFALTIYGVLPVLHNTIAGIGSVPPAIVESARGMGFTPGQTLRKVELPLASAVIIAGIRVSVVINVSTSTIGAIAGAGGLGAPIISGLANSDPAVTLQGALLTTALALILDGYLGAVQHVAEGRSAQLDAA
ncbi:MAG: ABC transporter permease [Coriobacteriales bacterium]|nr:ABC transporter permease [Coriobacteriales bacterium]